MAAPAVGRRELLEGAGVALVAGAAGYVGFVALGPPPDADDDHGGDDDSSGTGSGPLVALADVPDGGGLVLRDEKLVLTRSGATVHSVNSNTPVRSSVVYQDMIYRAGGGVAGSCPR